jgi:hypothetical protein
MELQRRKTSRGVALRRNPRRNEVAPTSALWTQTWCAGIIGHDHWRMGSARMRAAAPASYCAPNLLTTRLQHPARRHLALLTSESNAALLDVATHVSATNAASREPSDAPIANRAPALPSDGAPALGEHPLPAPTGARGKQVTDEGPSGVAQLKPPPMGTSVLREEAHCACFCARLPRDELTSNVHGLATTPSARPWPILRFSVAPRGLQPLS